MQMSEHDWRPTSLRRCGTLGPLVSLSELELLKYMLSASSEALLSWKSYACVYWFVCEEPLHRDCESTRETTSRRSLRSIAETARITVHTKLHEDKILGILVMAEFSSH